MRDGILIVDATVHGFNFAAHNRKYPFLAEVVRMLHTFAFEVMAPAGEPEYYLTLAQFEGMFELFPQLLEEVLFAESCTDVACYHGVPMYGLFGDGSSPLWVGDRIRQKLPHRMYTYGDISPSHPEPFAHIERLVDEFHVSGVKFYPVDLVEGKITHVRMDDERSVFPLLERCRHKGIKVVAVHKAVPLGPLPLPLYGVSDMAPAIEAFPDLTFEIVHGGFAFAEETADLLEDYPNVTINLESTPCLALNQSDKFATMLAPLLATGAHDRIFYATGAPGMHPQPYVDAFLRFRMPRAYPQLTEEMKVGILGLNFVRMHGWDIEAIKSKCRKDLYGLEEKVLQRPWALLRSHMAETV